MDLPAWSEPTSIQASDGQIQLVLRALSLESARDAGGDRAVYPGFLDVPPQYHLVREQVEHRGFVLTERPCDPTLGPVLRLEWSRPRHTLQLYEFHFPYEEGANRRLLESLGALAPEPVDEIPLVVPYSRRYDICLLLPILRYGGYPQALGDDTSQSEGLVC